MKFTSILITLLLLTTLSSCFKGKYVDIIIHNATIHTLNEQNDIYDAIAISDGKIIEVGAERQILNKYRAHEEIDGNKRSIYPGIYDFQTDLSEGVKRKLSLDLSNSYSLDEVIFRMEKHLQINKHSFILAYNFDTTQWQNDKVFSFDLLNKHFKNTPIIIVNKNNQDVLMNQKSIELCKLNSTDRPFKYNFIKNKIPNYSTSKTISALNEILYNFLQYGITDIHTINCSQKTIKALQKIKSPIHLIPSYSSSFIQEKTMIYFNFKNIKTIKEKENFIFETEKKELQVYFNPEDSLELETSIQMCEQKNQLKKDHRWIISYSNEISRTTKKRIVESGAFITFLPSTSKNNSNYYPFKPMINEIGIYLIGSNFPMSKFYPHEIIYNTTHSFNKNSLTLNETMKGYCYWPSFANFKENSRGTLEKGKDATLVVFEKPMSFQNEKSTNYANSVYIKGKKVYSIE